MEIELKKKSKHFSELSKKNEKFSDECIYKSPESDLEIAEKSSTVKL